MQTNQARAIHTRKRKTRRTYVSVILVVSCFFSVPVFAQQTQTSGATLDGVQSILQSFISIMSRWRVVLAALAGKMMTNDWVFGAALHMDIYLRKIWNIMKNFANFLLIAFLLGSLIKNLVDKKDLDIKWLITKTLIAGILIQASRFMMWALVDVSTVAVSAIGSFPISFMQGNAEFKSRMTTEVSLIKHTNINIDGHSANPVSIENGSNNDTPNPMTDQEILNSLMPSANSLGWPLIFLGSSVFRFYEYMGQNSSQTTKTLAIDFSLKTVVLAIYTIALLLLLIANIVRVAFLRIFIITSPFIVLFQVFKDHKMPGGNKWITKYLSLSSLLDLVFKPVMFMAMMSLILILVVSMQNIMSWSNPEPVNGVSLSFQPSTKTANLTIEWVSSVTMVDNLFLGNGTADAGKSIFADMILFFLTIFLVWELIKMSLTSGSGPIQDVMKPLTKFVEDYAKTAPVIWWRSFNNVVDTSSEVTKKYAEGFGLDSNRKSWRFTTAEKEFQNNLRRKLGLGGAWTDTDFKELDKDIASGNPDAFWNTSRSKASGDIGEWLYMGVSSGAWRTRMKKWFDTYKNTIKAGTDGRWTEYTWDIDTFLGKGKDGDTATKKNRRKVHELMWGNAASKKTWDKDKNPPTYDQLMNNVYYAGTE